jgi:hypothetical protein
MATEHVADGEQLVGRGVRSGHGATVGHAVEHRARRREPERAGADRLVDERGHRRDVVGGRGRVVEAALAHRPVADRAVADHAADVDALREAVELGEVLAVRLPVPREAVEDAGGGDVLDRLHHLGEVLAVLGLARREGDAAVAEHDRRDTVPARRRRHRVPADLGVEVGVDVDEPRAHDATFCLDRLAAVAVDIAHGRDPVARHRHVAPERRSPGAVDHRPVPDHQVVSHARPLVLSGGA